MEWEISSGLDSEPSSVEILAERWVLGSEGLLGMEWEVSSGLDSEPSSVEMLAERWAPVWVEV